MGLAHEAPHKSPHHEEDADVVHQAHKLGKRRLRLVGAHLRPGRLDLRGEPSLHT